MSVLRKLVVVEVIFCGFVKCLKGNMLCVCLCVCVLWGEEWEVWSVWVMGLEYLDGDVCVCGVLYIFKVSVCALFIFLCGSF